MPRRKYYALRVYPQSHKDDKLYIGFADNI